MACFGVCRQQRCHDFPQGKHFLAAIGTSEIHLKVGLAYREYWIRRIEQRSPRLQLRQIAALFFGVGTRAVNRDSVFYVKCGEAVQLLDGFFPTLRHGGANVQGLIPTGLERCLHFVVVVMQRRVEGRQGQPLGTADNSGPQHAVIGVGSKSRHCGLSKVFLQQRCRGHRENNPQCSPCLCGEWKGDCRNSRLLLEW